MKLDDKVVSASNARSTASPSASHYGNRALFGEGKLGNRPGRIRHSGGWVCFAKHPTTSTGAATCILGLAPASTTEQRVLQLQLHNFSGQGQNGYTLLSLLITKCDDISLCGAVEFPGCLSFNLLNINARRSVLISPTAR